MKTIIKKLHLLTVLFVLFAVLFFCMGCSAKEYRITEAELTQLELNLTQLENNNKLSTEELQTLRKQQTALQSQVATLNTQLINLKLESETLENSLQTANELLDKYEQEAQRKISKVKTQRNIAYVLLAGVLYASLQ